MAADAAGEGGDMAVCGMLSAAAIRGGDEGGGGVDGDRKGSDMSYDIILADVLDWAVSYKGEPFHAMLCDPPYHLTSIVKRFGQVNSAPAKGDVYNRSSRGFMGQQWDGGDIAFRPETWQALGQHLYPGGFGLAFASSRGWHRMACAIEDAGLIIHPSIFMFGWLYLSGFPKATRIDSAIDRANGNIRPDKLNGGHIGMGVAAGDGDNENELHNQIPHVIGKGNHSNGTPIDPLAQAWVGHRYGLQAMKPALEPIILFQRPYEGRPVDNITETGAGALWIDGGRVEANGEDRSRDNSKCKTDDSYFSGKARINQEIPGDLGRWPSNLVLVHHPACNGECHPDCAVRALDEQSGILTSGGRKMGQPGGTNFAQTHIRTVEFNTDPDSGPASRMFYQADWSHEVAEQLANATPLRYEPKASSAEREAGLAEMETVTRHRVNAGGLENEPRFAPTEVKNNHPTVKSISLAKYLATLLLPPAAYAPRRIFVPFCGVGSEMIGATLAGWEDVTGIERESAYVNIANPRLEWWSKWPGWGQTDVDKILQADDSPSGQLSFLEAAR